MPLTASFPGAIKTFVEVTDGVTEMTSTDINPPYAEITAIETELGIDPAGTATDVKTRLARSLSGSGNLNFATATELTISGGVITPTQNWHIVDTQGDAATDELDTIGSTDSVDGFVLYLRQANDARDITIKHLTGNIFCPRGYDLPFYQTNNIVCLIYDSVIERWIVVSPATMITSNGYNTFALENVFQAAMSFAYTTVAADTTLTASHYCVDVNATAAARTITLPTAVGCAGREYIVCKLDASGNAVTVEGDGAETVNGAANFPLAAQYDTVAVMSTGAEWRVIWAY
jgi:hypothetical protein